MENDEHLVETFLNGAPRAETWRQLKETLQNRLNDLRAEQAALPPTDSRRAGLDRKIREMKAQVTALAEEEIVSRFVEDSVRATVARPHPLETGIDTDS